MKTTGGGRNPLLLWGIPIILGLSLVLMGSFSQASFSQGSCSPVGAPTFHSNCFPAIPIVTVTFRNDFGTMFGQTFTAIVLREVYNSTGQYVDYSTATTSPASGQTQAAYFGILGLPYGTYSAVIFVISTHGTALWPPLYLGIFSIYGEASRAQKSAEPLALISLTEPSVCATCGYLVNYRNNSPQNYTAIIVGSVQNSNGQTVYISTGTIDEQAGAN